MAHDRLIADLFADPGHRQTVRAIVSTFPPTMTPDRVSAVIHELARPAPDGQTPQQAADYIASFIGAIGGMEHEQQAFIHWIDSGGPGAGIPEPPVVEPAPDEAGDDSEIVAITPSAVHAMVNRLQSPPPVPADPTREVLQAQIRQHEADMRSEPGSPQWRQYWQHGGADDCLQARRTLEAMQTAPVDTTAEGTP
jgi:hypothetical protein